MREPSVRTPRSVTLSFDLARDCKPDVCKLSAPLRLSSHATAQVACSSTSVYVLFAVTTRFSPHHTSSHAFSSGSKENAFFECRCEAHGWLLLDSQHTSSNSSVAVYLAISLTAITTFDAKGGEYFWMRTTSVLIGRRLTFSLCLYYTTKMYEAPLMGVGQTRREAGTQSHGSLWGDRRVARHLLLSEQEINGNP
jgi:hypothetical protein